MTVLTSAECCVTYEASELRIVAGLLDNNTGLLSPVQILEKYAEMMALRMAYHQTRNRGKIAKLACPGDGTQEVRFFSGINVERSGLAGYVEVTVDITHTYRGDVSLKLFAPDGSKYTLKSKNAKDGEANIYETYVGDISGNATGTWNLRIKDHYDGDEGQLNSWSIKFQ